MGKTKEQIQSEIAKLQDKLKTIEEKELAEKNKVNTKIVKLPFGTFEVETKIHHLNKTYAECEKDCPKGWEIATYQLLQELRNIQPEEFNLINTWEFIQQPDEISKRNNYVARFDAYSIGAGLDCYGGPTNSGSSLGVRYFRRVSQSKHFTKSQNLKTNKETKKQ